jgi:histidine ammonia-lyase
VRASRATIEQLIASGQTIYGVNTGFGKLCNVRIPADQLARLQENLLLSHAVGVGTPVPPEIVRFMLLFKINALLAGASGISPQCVECLAAMLNADILPVVPSRGSLGASGDLAPLAHLALGCIGEGDVLFAGEILPASVALERAGIEPLVLEAKEGLALLNGTQVSTALLADAVLAARRLARVADVACAFTLEAYKGTDRAFDARIHALRGHPGQQVAAANLRRLLAGSAILPGHADCARVQDPYSLRCAPQVHGASRDVLAHVERVLLAELHAVTDNPLVLDGADIVSGGNFHAQPIALAADTLKLAAAEWASISERRIELLVNPDVSGLPAFLARKVGVQSGLMIAQVTAAALVSENKVLAHPASVDSIPTSAGKEDHVSMAPAAARQCRQVLTNAACVVAIELMAGYHALAFEPRLRPGKGVAAARRALARVLRPLSEDRVLSTDIEAVVALVEDGTLLAAVERAVGVLD